MSVRKILDYFWQAPNIIVIIDHISEGEGHIFEEEDHTFEGEDHIEEVPIIFVVTIHKEEDHISEAMINEFMVCQTMFAACLTRYS